MTTAKALYFLILVTLFGLILILFSLFYKNETLSCRRVEPRLPIICELSKSNVFVATSQEFELIEATIAEDVQTRSRKVSGQNSRTIEVQEKVYWVVLETNSGEVSLSHFTGRSTIINLALDLANRINWFIHNPQETIFTYSSWPSIQIRWSAGILGIVLVGLGLGLIYRLSIHLDKN